MEWEPFEWELPDGALARAAIAAQSDVPVLLIGETGTGHEGVARYIHAHSGRASGPFTAVNCGVFLDSFLEEELVGRERGTGDNPRRPSTGLIGLAAGGVLFAYPIGPTGPRAERVLRRLLNEGVYQPLGATQPHKADVRVMAATNDGRHPAGDDGQDLFRESRVFEIYLPPLRERRDEIPNLAKRHVACLCAATGRGPIDLGPSALVALQAHSWPGNLRELFNALARAVLTSDNESIAAEDLPTLQG